MAWANAALIGQLAGLTDEALGLSSPRNEWTVAMILQHQVDAADRYAARLEGVPRPARDRAADHGRPSSPRSPLAAPPSTRGSAPRPPSRTGRRPRRTRRSPVGRDRPSSPRRSTTRPSIGPRSRAPSRPTGSTRSTSTPSTCGPTATPRASGRSPRRRAPTVGWTRASWLRATMAGIETRAGVGVRPSFRDVDGVATGRRRDPAWQAP